MLVLQRKRGERIVLSDGVIIEVAEIRGSAVRLGVTAPAAMKILREELLRVESRESRDESKP